jgi:hypothetical protein
MSETIVLTVNAEVASGPTLTENVTLAVDAYDKLSVTVPDATTLAVELQPGAAGVRLLIITSSRYGDALKYTVNADTTKDHVLDQPHVLLGTGAVGLFGAMPTKLTFKNALGAGHDAEIQILIGRDATP